MKGRALDNAGRTASAVQRGFVGYFDRVLSTEVTRVEAAGIARRTRLGVAQIELEKAQNNRREVLIAHTQPCERDRPKFEPPTRPARNLRTRPPSCIPQLSD